MEGIQKYLAQWNSGCLENLEEELIGEYNEILEQEELFWWQKAREDWWVEGENNTRYFHSLAMARRKRQTVNQLQDAAGEWMVDQGILRDVARNFYKALYTTDHTQSCCSSNFHFPRLCSEDVASLHR